MPFRKLLNFSLAVLLLASCALKSQNQTQNLAGGDSEPIHGGDTVDLRVTSVRNKTVITLNQIKTGSYTTELGAKPTDCSQYKEPQFCDALDLTTGARDELRGFFYRNLDALIAVNAGDNRIPVVVTNEAGSFTSPTGEKRSVLAWVALDSKGRKIIKLNIGARDISDSQLLALLFHESLHLVVDSKLGHNLTDDEGVPGFDGSLGGGRRLADTAGAALSLLVFPAAQTPPNNTAPNFTLNAPKTTAQFNPGGNSILDGQLLFADVDGNKTQDAIFIDRDNSVWISKGSINGYEAPTKWAQHSGSFQRKQYQFADINGDKKDDLLFQNSNGTIELYLSNGSAFAEPVVVGNINAAFKAGQVQYADVNGDGKLDMIFQNDINEFRAAISNGAAFGALSLWFTHGPSFYEYTALYGDFDGGGKMDLVMQQASATKFWLTPSNGTNFVGPPIMGASFSGDWSLGRSILGDINGDGKSDLVFVDANNVIWVGISTGSSFSPQPALLINGVFVPGRLQVRDIDADGRADVIYQKEDSTYFVALSTGTKLTDWKPIALANYAVNAGAFSVVKFANVVPSGLSYVDQLGKIWLATPRQ